MATVSERRVLVVAGSDSSGDAGIARDVETVAALGLRTCLAVTALTVQTDASVEHVEPVASNLVAAQMRAAFDGNRVAAVKIGMLGIRATAEAVASVLRKHPSVAAVLDPVLAATSGPALLSGDAMATFQPLLPLCRLITPNLPELARLAGSQPAGNETELLRQGRILLDAGAPALLVKGGHATGDRSTDILLRPGCRHIRFQAPRLSRQMRGTGCMLASAIAAHLALDTPLEESVRKAKDLVLQRISRAA